MRRSCLLPGVLLLCVAASSRAASDEPSFAKARESARIAGYSLSKVQRWLHEKCLPAIDKETGLYRGQSRTEWSYRDTAADCYPFVIWAAFYTDRGILDGPMRDILHAEQRLCNHVDRLPVDYDLAKKQKHSRSLDQIIFGASVYAKGVRRSRSGPGVALYRCGERASSCLSAASGA